MTKYDKISLSILFAHILHGGTQSYTVSLYLFLMICLLFFIIGDFCVWYDYAWFGGRFGIPPYLIVFSSVTI